MSALPINEAQYQDLSGLPLSRSTPDPGFGVGFSSPRVGRTWQVERVSFVMNGDSTVNNVTGVAPSSVNFTVGIGLDSNGNSDIAPPTVLSVPVGAEAPPNIFHYPVSLRITVEPTHNVLLHPGQQLIVYGFADLIGATGIDLGPTFAAGAFLRAFIFGINEGSD